MPNGQKSCSRCGLAFTCGLAAGESSCWCASLPRIMPVDGTADCLCPGCLQAEIDRRQAAESDADEANASAGLDFTPRDDETE